LVSVSSLSHSKIVDRRGDTGWVTDFCYPEASGFGRMSARLQGYHSPSSAEAAIKSFRSRWERDPANPNNRKGY